MIKSIKTLPQQISSIEVSDESDIESLGTEYGVGSTVRVTGQISAEFILTPDGWEKIGGGNKEPLVLTAIPSEQSIFSGTVSGATKEEILDAWNSGRLIYLTIGSLSVPLTYYETNSELSYMSANFRLIHNTQPHLAVGNLWLNQMRYSVDLYPLDLN